jgi:glycosyltransferase involved in cell wall biosynthesis
VTRVLHTVGSLRHTAGGPARSVQGLVAALGAETDVTPCLLSFTPGDQAWLPGVQHFQAARSGGYRGALMAARALIDHARPDLIHIHGIWSAGSHASAVCARQRAIPYCIAPRGMLEPWALNIRRWKKRLALWLYQRRDLRGASLLHATSAAEAAQFARLGFRQACIVSPNGVNVPARMPPQATRHDGRRRVLFLSRIHPKKGLLELVAAWAEIKAGENNAPAGAPRWLLEIAGTDADDYQRVVRKEVAMRGLSQSVVFSGPLDDERKWESYRRADIFVLPTRSENFGIVVAEALYAGVPVITTRGAPWAELEGSGKAATGRCGWWIENGVVPLTKALRQAMSLSDEERHAMGRQGRALVENAYVWPPLAREMAQAYRETIVRAREATPRWFPQRRTGKDNRGAASRGNIEEKTP